MNFNKRGISLIVLVIEIVVLITIAAAVILVASGDDLRDKANEAVSANDLTSAKELVALAKSEWEFKEKELSKQYKNFKQYAQEKLDKKGMENVLVSNKGAVNIIYTDKNGDKAIIPDGFVVSEIETENVIKYGLVIYSGNEAVTEKNLLTARETRDQFVWIPVPDMSKFVTTDMSYTEPVSVACIKHDSGECLDEVTLSITNDLTGEWAEYNALKKSVKEYGGFYIGRYESGTSNDRSLKEVIGTTDVFVQKNKYVYNYVAWGKNMATIDGDITSASKNRGVGAVKLSRGLYNTNSVKSHLIYGVEWDVALKFIKEVDTTYFSNYQTRGNYNGEALIKTGTNEAYAANNIYDMAGNVWERTMESNKSTSRAYRGGGFKAERSPSLRAGYYANWCTDELGFRIALYLV